MRNRIYILTAVHNDLEDTKKLLSSIYAQTFKDVEVFLVDDGSTDGTSKYIKSNYPKVNVIEGDGNLWWTASLNLGLKKILEKAKEDDFVWIINNDCFFSKDVLGKLLLFVKSLKGKKNIVGSIVLDAKTKRVFESGVKINWRKLKFKQSNLKKGEKIDALPTKGTLYPVKAFKELSLFDAKHFPHYFSDYEYTIRAKRSGYRLLICPASKIYNRSERTGKNSLSFSKKSKINPLLQLNIVRVACPKKYRLKCYILLISKLIHGRR